MLKRVLPFLCALFLGVAASIIFTREPSRDDVDAPTIPAISYTQPYTAPLHILEAPEVDFGNETDGEFAGQTTLEVTFDANGTISEVEVTKPIINHFHPNHEPTAYQALNQLVVAAAKRIKFVPAKRWGQSITTKISIDYHLACVEMSCSCLGGRGEPYIKRQNRDVPLSRNMGLDPADYKLIH